MRLRPRSVTPLLTALLLTAGLLTACGGSTDAHRASAHHSPSRTASAGAAPRPQVRGNRLVDARTGADFVPRGLNWSSFEYACVQGWGMSALDTLGSDGPATEAAAIASWHVNTVRLPLNQDCWLGTRGAPVSDTRTTRTPAEYQADVRAFVTALNKHGVVVILDLQSRKRVDVDEFGNLAMPDADSLAFWRSVAHQYAGDPSVMFDAFNEPYSRYDAAGTLVFDLTWGCWRDGGCTPPAVDDRSTTTGQTYQAVGMAQVVSTIRAAGAHQPILLGGLDYANDLSQWLSHAPADDQLVAAFHSYDFKRCLAACWDQVLGPLAAKVPVLASELGATNPLSGYVTSFLDWADRHRVGVLFWGWLNDPSDPMALTSDQAGTPTAYGRLAQAWLDGHSGS